MPASRRVALIEPSSEGIHVYKGAALPRLGTVLLGTILRDAGWEVSVQVEEVRPLDLDHLLEADVVGISTITPTAARSYGIARRLRAQGKTVVLGGPHVTWCPDEALEEAPYVVRGEGEVALVALLEALARSEPDLSQVPGLSWKDDRGENHHNPLADPVALDSLPNPDLSLIWGYTNRPAFGPRRVVPVQTSRGCPYDCSFCTVHTTFGRKMRYRSTDRVMADLSAIDGTDVHVFFYDDNFVVNRRRALDLLGAMKAARLGLNFSAQVRADIGRDPEILRALKDAGCLAVYIGLESVNEAALKVTSKRQTVAQMTENVTRIREAGIGIHGMFVLGFDDDDEDTVRSTIDYAVGSGIHSVQFMILTPLPGSEIARQIEAEGRLRTKDWSLYDAHHVVFLPARISPAALQAAQVEGHRRFYSLRRTLRYAWERDWRSAGISLYARGINTSWSRNHRGYLSALRVLGDTDGPHSWARAFELVPRREVPGAEGQVGGLSARSPPRRAGRRRSSSPSCSRRGGGGR